jgi:hypothetical protein
MYMSYLATPQTSIILEVEADIQCSQVNRLTRELTALRAHSASVASTASSASTAPNPADAQYPTASRRPRSSSSVSRGSFSHGIPLTSATAGIPHYHRRNASGARDGVADPPMGLGLSRTTSTASASGVSGVSTARYEETAQARIELEEAKKENERLRQRVRELEGLLRSRRSSTVESVRGTSAERTEGRGNESAPAGTGAG